MVVQNCEFPLLSISLLQVISCTSRVRIARILVFLSSGSAGSVSQAAAQGHSKQRVDYVLHHWDRGLSDGLDYLRM